MTQPAQTASTVRQLGPYRIIGEIGEGGMGLVLRAEHTLIGRPVAIKLLNAEVASDPSIRSRFFLEARIVNEIRHPNIVEVTDFGMSDDQPYIVMEYLQGHTLSERIHQAGAFAEARAIAIARQIASALGAVHERGIVHRDLKSDNVFLSDHLDYPDFVKILDFGIAKPPRAGGNHRTQTGTVVGTPAYMSPEQCMGDVALDQRSDVYSLGVVMFQMVTGHLPFEAEGVGRVMVAHIQDPPPPAGASARLEAIIQRCLAKQPPDRFAHMRELRDALGAALSDQAPLPAQAAVTRKTAAVQRVTPAGSARAVLDPAHRQTTNWPAPQPEADLLELCRSRLGEIEISPPSASQTGALALSQSQAFSFPAALELTRRDPRLAEAIIRMANMEPYGGRVPVSGVAQAVSRIGALGLCLVVVEQLARPLTEAGDGRAAAMLRSPWRHALASAYLARRLAGALRPGIDPAHAYLVGLLLRIGRPVVARFVDELERRPSPRFGRRSVCSESSILEAIASHEGAMTERVAQTWLLPPPVRDALLLEPPTPQAAQLRRLGHLASSLADAEGYFVRREHADQAATEVQLGRMTLRIDDATLAEARRCARPWVAARG